MPLIRLSHRRDMIFEHMKENTTLFWEFGVASVRRIFEIIPSDFNEYLLGKRTAREIDFKAETDRWPPTEEERRESRRKFISKHPASLIDIPKNRKLFSKEELEKLIPIAEQMWIDWRGKLPDDYVSPLE